MAIFRRTFVAACALALLSSCGMADRALEHAAEDLPALKFGTATRERLETDELGSTFRLMIESNTKASWLDADKAMFRQLKYQCRDGEPITVVSETPSTSAEGGFEIGHPAGTTFIRIIRCAAPPPYEFVFEPGLSEAEAMEAVRERLGRLEGPDPNRHIVTKVNFNPRDRKYPAISRHVGEFMAYRMRRCADGVSVNRIVIGSFPAQEPGELAGRHRAHVMLGMDAPCQPPPTGLATES